ncbi:MAG: hypothetical protein R2712_10320 [Vicinamibacterales bacterium]
METSGPGDPRPRYPLSRRGFVQRLVGGTGFTASGGVSYLSRIVGGAALGPLFGVTAAHAVLRQIDVAGDTTLRSDQPDTNFGTDGQLTVEVQGADSADALVIFDPTAVSTLLSTYGPADEVTLVTQVVIDFTPTFETITAEACSTTQTEGDATFNNTAAGTPPGAEGGYTGPGELSFDVTALVNGGATTFRIRRTTTSGDGGMFLASRENGGQAGPALVFNHFDVTPTPTPSASPVPTPTPSASPVPTPTPSASPVPTPTPSASPVPTPTPSASPVPTPTPSASPVPTPTPSATPVPTPTPSATPIPTPTPSPTFSRVPGAPLLLSYAVAGQQGDAAVTAPGADAAWGFAIRTFGFDQLQPAQGRIARMGDSPTATTFRVRLSWLPPTTGGLPADYIIEAGSVAGASNLLVQATAGAATTFDADAPAGTYYVRVRGRNAYGLGPPSSELLVTLGATGCMSEPQAPGPLAATVDGLQMSLALGAAPGATAYLLEVGATPGGVEHGRRNIGGLPALVATGPPGTYYLRVRGLNACGTGAPSNDVAVTLSTSVAPPGAPDGLTHLLTGRTVTLAWQAPSAGGPVDNYIVEVGSQIGLTDVGTMMTPQESLVAANAPPGTYYVRVRAMNVAGIGPATADMRVDVF